MKPVGLLRKIMPNGTRLGDFVYDPFGGSGSTLMASDHMKRRCIMVEMEVGYVETIIKRWEQLAPGNKAKQV
jgi:DNA modification methylase